ncbi:MAG: protein disulfide oxidoreductase [Campylobacterota bacterium]|nr:protein disulfide oxidoreductase [Campylobacterota bacterium]
MKNIRVKKIVKEVLIGAVILFVISNVVSYLRKPVLQDDRLPAISVQTIEGKNIDLNSYRGKPLLIHFWATWCPVCKMETANIERVSEKYQVITIAVNSGDNEKIKAFLREQGAGFQVINDDEGNFAGQFSVEVFPTTFIYDSSGKLFFSEVGYTSTAGLLGRMALAE